MKFEEITEKKKEPAAEAKEHREATKEAETEAKNLKQRKKN
ncbi:MAG: hypothetical protein ABIA76_01975 [Candidatus Diapherotrites archaeon]